MPNRIIKESICTSDNLNRLNAEEEVFFYRLLVNCDDYGRIDGRPSILRSRCFPLRLESVKESHIEKWLKTLIDYDLIFIYQVENKIYLQIKTWESHQQIRAKRSKFPSPDDGTIISDSTCNHMISDDSICPRNPNPNPNPNPNRERESGNHLLADDIKQKKSYGEFQNVFLTDSEHDKLVTKFSAAGASERIEKLSTGIASHGYKYKSHYATILSWENRDEKKNGGNSNHGGNRKDNRAVPAKYKRPEDYRREYNEQHAT